MSLRISCQQGWWPRSGAAQCCHSTLGTPPAIPGPKPGGRQPEPVPGKGSHLCLPCSGLAGRCSTNKGSSRLSPRNGGGGGGLHASGWAVCDLKPKAFCAGSPTRKVALFRMQLAPELPAGIAGPLQTRKVGHAASSGCHSQEALGFPTWRNVFVFCRWRKMKL